MIAMMEVASDPLLEALRISGPAGGLVVVLGILIKHWLGGLQKQVENVEEKVSELSAHRLQAVGDLSSIKTQLEEHSRRIKVVEEKRTL